MKRDGKAWMRWRAAGACTLLLGSGLLLAGGCAAPVEEGEGRAPEFEDAEMGEAMGEEATEGMGDYGAPAAEIEEVGPYAPDTSEDVGGYGGGNDGGDGGGGG